MELTRITKLLLFLLSKRPDIGELRVRDPEPADYSQDHDETIYAVCDPDYIDVNIEELYAELSPDEQRALQVDYLRDCFGKSLDDSAS